MGMDEVITSYETPGKRLELKKKTYEDSSYFYYLDSIPLSLSVGYSGSHNLEQMMLKFDSICEYMDNRRDR